MPNLIDKLTSKVDLLRQKAADKFGLPAHDLYRVLRTWSGGDLNSGTSTDVITKIYPTPMIKFSGELELQPHGLEDQRKMTASEVSLTYQENFLQGHPLVAGQECFYKLVERNGQGADTTYWILSNIPWVDRGNIQWVLEFKPYTVCE
jgi:hypothetical protein